RRAVLARQVRQPDFFQEQCFAAIVQLRRAGQGGRAHGWRTGFAVPIGGSPEAAVVGTTAVPEPVEGASVSGSVARPAATSPVGRNRGPFWPQPASTTSNPAASRRLRGALTRIWGTNIWK